MGPGGCFTKVSRALQDILSKFVYYRNRTSGEKFKLKICTWAQSKALGTRTKFQLKFLTINVISGIVYFREIILESSRNLSETTPRSWTLSKPASQLIKYTYIYLVTDFHILVILESIFQARNTCFFITPLKFLTTLIPTKILCSTIIIPNSRYFH